MKRTEHRSGQGREQYKRMVTFFSSVILMGFLTLLFANTWYTDYYDTIALPFYRRGNWVVIVIYTVVMYLFFRVYGGFKVDYRVDSPEELAGVYQAQRAMGYGGGLLVTNPIPEEFSMDKSVIDAAIETALAEANAAGVHGKETTPFLLDRALVTA